MPYGEHHRCKDCGVPDDVTHISLAGHCERCARARWKASLVGMMDKSSPEYEHWHARWLAGGGNRGRPSTPNPPGS